MTSETLRCVQRGARLVGEGGKRRGIVHRFRRDMVPDPENIKPTSRVQVVMDMDGWGPPWLKFDSYRDYVVAHPVQYTGFKIFYHNDTRKGDQLLTPGEVLRLLPRPMYIQYQ